MSSSLHGCVSVYGRVLLCVLQMEHNRNFRHFISVIVDFWDMYLLISRWSRTCWGLLSTLFVPQAAPKKSTLRAARWYVAQVGAARHQTYSSTSSRLSTTNLAVTILYFSKQHTLQLFLVDCDFSCIHLFPCIFNTLIFFIIIIYFFFQILSRAVL